MENDAKRNGKMYLAALFGASVAQISGFYYGIYMVEDWGWDVCEPFSYTF